MQTKLSPKGTFRWVAINGVENKTPDGAPTGKYVANLEISEEDYKALKEEIIKFFVSTDVYKELKKLDANINPMLPIGKKQDKDGNVYCVLRTKIPTTIKRKSGKEEPRVIPIYDGEQNRLPDDTKVFAGSKGRIEYFPTVWKTAFGHGVSFKLISLQVTHLEEGMGGGCPFPVDTSDEEDQGEIVL